MYFSHLYLSLFHDNNEAMEVDFNQNSQRLMVLVRKRWKSKVNKIWNDNIVSGKIIYHNSQCCPHWSPHSVMEQT